MNWILSRVIRLWQRFEDRAEQQDWVRIIYDKKGRPLLTRYYLCNTRWIEKFKWLKPLHGLSFRLVMHQMFESDEDGFHDHPWPWAGWILSTGYWEQTPIGEFWRPPGHLRFRSANSLHRLVLDPNHSKGGVFTLFAMGRKQRVWGFVDRNGVWEPWYIHIHNREENVA